MSKPNGILAMNPEKYREIDGVVFDPDSYARHCKPLFFTRKSARVKDETTGKYKTVYTYVPKKSYEAMIEALK